LLRSADGPGLKPIHFIGFIQGSEGPLLPPKGNNKRRQGQQPAVLAACIPPIARKLEKSDGWGTRVLSLHVKRTSNGKSNGKTAAKATATAKADSSAALRNDKQSGGMTNKLHYR